MNDESVLRLLTINTHKGFSPWNRDFVLHELRDSIQATSADVVFLQETVGHNARKAQEYDHWPEQPHYDFLAESVWPDRAYGRNMIYPHGHHGNAILSRYPIRRHETVDISTNRVEKRGFLHCEIDVPAHPKALHCICVHLSLFAVSRRKQLRMIASYMDEHVPAGAPVTIAGDFNDWSGRNVARFARSLDLHDVAKHIQGHAVRTFPSWLPVLPLDRVYSRGMRPVASQKHPAARTTRLSDHAGLLVEVVLESPAGVVH